MGRPAGQLPADWDEEGDHVLVDRLVHRVLHLEVERNRAESGRMYRDLCTQDRIALFQRLRRYLTRTQIQARLNLSGHQITRLVGLVAHKEEQDAARRQGRQPADAHAE